jgi:hypothetical protein
MNIAIQSGINPTIRLTSCELDLARYVIRHRIERNKRENYPVTDFTGLTDEERDFRSYVGELCFCKLFNISPDLQWQSRPYYDAILCGYKVDVKTQARKEAPGTQKLIVKQKDNQKFPDYYALMVGKVPSYTLYGFAHYSRVIQPQYYTEDKLHPCWVFPVENLAHYIGADDPSYHGE